MAEAGVLIDSQFVEGQFVGSYDPTIEHMSMSEVTYKSDTPEHGNLLLCWNIPMQNQLCKEGTGSRVFIFVPACSIQQERFVEMSILKRKNENTKIINKLMNEIPAHATSWNNLKTLYW